MTNKQNLLGQETGANFSTLFKVKELKGSRDKMVSVREELTLLDSQDCLQGLGFVSPPHPRPPQKKGEKGSFRTKISWSWAKN